MDLYKDVPKDFKKNLAYRLKLRERAEGNPAVQKAMIEACKTDVLWWLNTWAWLYEPRPRKGPDGKPLPMFIPFITWSHQDPAILLIHENLGYRDIGVEKARGEGASWIAVWAAIRDLVFFPNSAIGLVSKDENSVDNPDDSDSLMWKVQFGLDRLPSWMRPKLERNLSKHTIRNIDNGSVITGYAATGDVASGGRKKWFLMDELAKFRRGPDTEAMASTQHVTDSRLIVSTPKGNEGEYYKVMHEPSSMIKIVLDWKDNPTRNQGLYVFKNGLPVAVDPENNPLPANYNPPDREVLNLLSRLRIKGYKIEGCVRSPWFDGQCDRPGATPQNIAQELNRDYGGSMYRIFGHDFMAAAEAKIEKRPRVRGSIDYDHERLVPKFDPSEDGPILLWTSLDSHNRPPPRPYVVGADVASGLGGSYTSNSVIQVIDQVSMEQVLEISSNVIPPDDFADLAIAIAKWFYDAHLAWEANGPGAAFTNRVLKRRYSNVYCRTSLSKRGKVRTKELGFWTDERSKEVMFADMRRMIQGKELIIHSDLLLREFGQYVRINGKIEHVLNANAPDDAKGKAHGDRVIALGVALQAIKDRPLGSRDLEDALHEAQPRDCMASRNQAYEDLLAKESDVWDDRSTSDLTRIRSHAGSLHGPLQGEWGF